MILQAALLLKLQTELKYMLWYRYAVDEIHGQKNLIFLDQKLSCVKKQIIYLCHRLAGILLTSVCICLFILNASVPSAFIFAGECFQRDQNRDGTLEQYD